MKLSMCILGGRRLSIVWRVKVKSGKKATSKKYPEFIAVVGLANEPGISELSSDVAYKYR